VIEEGAGNSKTLRAQAELSYFLTMFQVNSAERGTRQMAVGTWVLAIATIGLLVATIVLAVITARGGGLNRQLACLSSQRSLERRRLLR
jgi:hypothetical protein